MSHDHDAQPIAGVTPSIVREQLVMEVWPSISAYGAGRLVGRLFQMPGRMGPVRITFFIGLLIFWLPLLLYFFPGRLLTRYTLTNRRLLIRRGFPGREVAGVALEEIDRVEKQVLPGQEYFFASDVLALASDGRELLRLRGVPQAESFVRAIQKAREARVRVLEALKEIETRKQKEQAASAEAAS